MLAAILRDVFNIFDQFTMNAIKVVFSAKSKQYTYLLPPHLVDKVHSGEKGVSSEK